jgi:DNA-binding transcriptional MerR regulator
MVAAKSDTAFRTISEAAEVIGVPQHVLRFWETRFTQLRPIKRGGNRRYYRPDDMALLHSIRAMLHDQGLTIRGAQQALAEQAKRPARPVPADVEAAGPVPRDDHRPPQIDKLRAIRDRLRAALAA